LDAQSRFQSGGTSDESLRAWARDIATESLDRFTSTLRAETPLVGWSTSDGNAWEPQKRNFSGGDDGFLISSHSRGETYVGILRSDAFVAPKAISFYLAGHVGPPGNEDHGKTFVRLVRVADNAVIQEARPPRNDTAQRISWTTEGQSTDLVRIEAHDGDDGSAYAWLAIGQFDPPWLDQTTAISHLQTAIRWATRLKINDFVEPLAAVLQDERMSSTVRIDTARAIASIEQKSDWEAVLVACQQRPQLPNLSEEILSLFTIDETVQPNDPIRDAIRIVASHLSVKDESSFAQQWVRTGGSSHRLLDACEAGWLNPAVLTESTVAEVLRARVDEAEMQRLQKLVSGVAVRSADDEMKHHEWMIAISNVEADVTKGADVFKRTCAACHQLRGTGAIVGPQLDGVLTRTDERLIEDILIPDRNVDAAFRTTSFLLDDGRVIVGMIQTEGGNEIKIIDQTGKVIQIDSNAIETRIESKRSLMPSNFSETLTATDLANLFLFMRKP
jgi:putative heme-binding domain-containing protein